MAPWLLLTCRVQGSLSTCVSAWVHWFVSASVWAQSWIQEFQTNSLSIRVSVLNADTCWAFCGVPTLFLPPSLHQGLLCCQHQPSCCQPPACDMWLLHLSSWAPIHLSAYFCLSHRWLPHKPLEESPLLLQHSLSLNLHCWHVVHLPDVSHHQCLSPVKPLEGFSHWSLRQPTELLYLHDWPPGRPYEPPSSPCLPQCRADPRTVSCVFDFVAPCFFAFCL